MRRTGAAATLRFAGRVMALALLAEAAFDSVIFLKDGRLPPLGLFAAGMLAVLLPFAPRPSVAPSRPLSSVLAARAAIAASLFLVVCVSATVVSLLNSGASRIGDISLAVLPVWYIVVSAILGLAGLGQRKINSPD